MSRRTAERSCTSIRAGGGKEYCIACEPLCAGRVTPRAREQALLTSALLRSAPLEATANDDGIAPSFAAIAIPFHPLSPIHRLDRPPSSFSPPSPSPLPSPQRSTKPGHTPTNSSSIGCCDETERGGKEEGGEKLGEQLVPSPVRPNRN